MPHNQEQDIEHIRHSLAHLLAAAVQELWPDAKPTIGPAIENGFYYDFEFAKPISDADLPKIEKKMRSLLPSWNKFTAKQIGKGEALAVYKNNPFKKELVEEIAQKGEEITFYTSGDFTDLCRGGHAENPAKEVKPDAFHLTHLAGAYWRGDEKNPMLTRIYGLAFATKKELDEHLQMMEEAKKRDHRKLGADLDLFTFSDLVGKGLPLLTPKGTVIRKELEKFIYETETQWGYQHVTTPPLAKVELYEKSGHYPYYKDTMYPVMQVDEDKLILRPMTCPHHFMLYKSKPHSYRELPMRIAELAQQFRYEKSGELTGLMRVRLFCLADAHIIISPDQAKDEIKNVLNLIDYVNGVFGLKKGVDYRYHLSLGDRKDSKKYYKDDDAWNKAETVLRSVLTEAKAPFFEAEGEAAFYGPKIDVQMKKVNGQEETAFTVQYDFVMPKRFELTYVDEKGKEQQPIVVHRSSIGALERTMAFLIERYAGAFPVWLATVQIAILPISDKLNDYVREIAKSLSGTRVWVDDRNESIGKKIREAEQQKIPYMLIIGEKEKTAGAVSVRQRGEKDLGSMPLAEFIEKITNEIEKRTI